MVASHPKSLRMKKFDKLLVKILSITVSFFENENDGSEVVVASGVNLPVPLRVSNMVPSKMLMTYLTFSLEKEDVMFEKLILTAIRF